MQDHISNADKIARERATPCHVGPITMAVGGRTDHIPMNVLEGSYVLPADIVSGLGEGNTLAGSQMINQMFKTGPFGTSAAAPKFQQVNAPQKPYAFQESLKDWGMNQIPQLPVDGKADGGPVMSGKYRPVPIVAAGGEYVLHPDVVKRIGGGNIERGHNWLDHFVVGVRKNLVKTLNKLPPPKRD